MNDLEIIKGNNEICKLLLFESDKPYIYKIPNLFPFEKDNDTGWTEIDVLVMQFHTDWNMLIGAYNRAWFILNDLPDTAKILLKDDDNFIVNFSIRNFFAISIGGQLNISTCWLKLVDFAKWYNIVNKILS